jgi:hypothetical protein
VIHFHAALKWYDAYDSSLWPLAIQYICGIYNKIPRSEADVTPEEIFSQVLSNHTCLPNAQS